MFSQSLESLLRLILPIYFIVYVVLTFVYRTYRVYRRTGVNPYALGNSDSAHDYIGLLLRWVIIAVGATVVVYALLPSLYAWLIPIRWLEHPLLVALGVALLIGSLVWTVIAQGQMGASWRIGIDSGNRTELVDDGLFKLSRNPIFLGMRASLLGFFLVIPNAVTLAALVLGEALMQIQVRLEEEYLLRAHGDAYRAYQLRTPRWLLR